MIIGITSRNLASNNGPLKGVPYTYISSLNDATFQIIDSDLKLTDDNKKYINRLLSLVDGVILPGGDKISEIDDYIISYCYKYDIPLIGICLGMQEIASHFSSPIKKIGSSIHYNFSAPYLHYINIDENSYMYKIIKDKRIAVNSRHNYKIERNDNYDVMAVSDDNIIEAIKVKNTYYMVGYQFHPEVMEKYDLYAKLLFKDFINQIKKVTRD